MTYLLGRRASPVAGLGVARLARRLRRLFRSVADCWQRHAAIQDLRRLNTRVLRDVGIERGEIESVIDDMLAARRRIE